MNYPSPFPTFATAVLNQLAASLWLSLLRTFPISDTLGLMMLEQLAFSHWAAQELARKQSRDLAAGAESDSPAMLRLSRERRAECRLQAQLARQLNQQQRTLAVADAKLSKADNTYHKMSKENYTLDEGGPEIGKISYSSDRTHPPAQNAAKVSPDSLGQSGKRLTAA